MAPMNLMCSLCDCLCRNLCMRTSMRCVLRGVHRRRSHAHCSDVICMQSYV